MSSKISGKTLRLKFTHIGIIETHESTAVGNEERTPSRPSGTISSITVKPTLGAGNNELTAMGVTKGQVGMPCMLLYFLIILLLLSYTVIVSNAATAALLLLCCLGCESHTSCSSPRTGTSCRIECVS
jgi:hypothetical protein